MTQQVYPRYFILSLWTLVAMVYLMIILGGVTRLTGSGLSIVEWKPITGIFPPWTHQAWMMEFSKYQTSPEFQQLNFNFTLQDFKNIFWLEYLHRLWGRLIGLILLAPTYYVIRHKDLSIFRIPVLVLWILGAGQGFMGWYMVKSGLHQYPHVSPYRLTSHLILALAIFSCLLWMLLKEKWKVFPQELTDKTILMSRYTLVLLVCAIVTIIYGGFVAGHKAGLMYNTFPLMGGDLMPEDAWFYKPWWINMVSNPATVQWLHRCLAMITVGLTIGLTYMLHQYCYHQPLKIQGYLLLVTAILQGSLGILTLLYHVPIVLGVLHQGVAILFFSIAFVLWLTARSVVKAEAVPL